MTFLRKPLRGRARLAFLRTLFALLLPLMAGALTPGPRAQTPEGGRFILCKYQLPIGEEVFEIKPDGDGLSVNSRFELTFVGGRVLLNAQLRLGRRLLPVRFNVKGRSSTRTEVDREIEVSGSQAVVREGARTRTLAVPPRFFVTGGHAPVALRMMLFRYWKRGRAVGRVPLLPQGGATFKRLGRDRVTLAGREAWLERFYVEGVAWGRETVWFDEGDNLVALVGADAEMDRFEAVRAGYESALPFFVRRAAQDAVGHLEELAREVTPVRQGRYAIVGGLLIDATGRTAVPDSVVLVEGGRIAAAGARAEVRVPRGVPVLDARGMSVLPGLFDTHAHATQAEWFPVSLAAGVTTMRDAANESEFIIPVREAIRAGRALGPRLVLAGYVDSGPHALGSVRVETAAEARAAVARYARAGYEQIKVYQSLRPELVRVVADEAHRLGLTVTGHVPTGMDAFEAVEAGMDQINHINFLTRALRGRGWRPRAGAEPPPLDTDSAAARAAVQFFKERGTVVEPTLARGEMNRHARGTPFSALEPGMGKLPFELAAALDSTGVPAELVPRARAAEEAARKATAALHGAGVPVVAGSDLAVPGHSVFRELELLVGAGLTPSEAIRAATIVAARALELERELGTVERGKVADLIVVDGNPLESIGAIRRVRYVVKGGKMYDTARLWRSAGFRP